MRIFDWVRLKKLLRLLATDRPEPVEQARRIITVQRDVVLPAKAGVCLVVLGYLVFSGWLEEPSTRGVVLETLKHFFEVYLGCTILGALFFVVWRRLPVELFQWVAFVLGLLDGLFMAGLVVVTGGFDSIAFWVFPPLIILNALSIPLAMPQIALNLLLSLLYMVAVLVTPALTTDDTVITGTPHHVVAALRGTNQMAGAGQGNAGSNGSPTAAVSRPDPAALAVARAGRTSRVVSVPTGPTGPPAEEIAPGQLLIRASMLWLLMLCCYGAQVLSERQREALQEAAEFASREGQLHSAGRLAAEFAHQIKNPLAIINNTAYSLKRALRDNRTAAQQIEIIQEEVARADKVVTQIMGYAQLSEGRVERLKVVEEIDRAVEQVFPEPEAPGTKLVKQLKGPFPVLLMQRGHLTDILMNLLLNARQALAASGTVQLTAACNRDHAVEIIVADDGPGIPPDKVERIFEPYFTTKEKGTGLGLTIVKHNTELYGGTVRVESILGKGAKFTVTLPARSQPKPFLK
jgi:nitrogen-specific signal transduction histidine kinase